MASSKQQEQQASSSSVVSKTDRPFGAWESPISSRSITAGSIRIGGLHIVPASKSDNKNDDSVYWSEGRPLEAGRNVLCRWKGESKDKSESEEVCVEVTPKEINVRSRVHEYGGAATTFTGDHTLYYTEFASQQVYQMSLTADDDKNNKQPRAVTVDDEKGRYRYADGIYDEARDVLICVREDHGTDGKADPKDVVNEIVAIDIVVNENSANENTETETTTAATAKATRVLVTGYDFVAAPRLSNDGATLACIVWDHPNMPWDATKLVTVSLPEDLFGDDNDVGTPTVIAGQDNDTSVLQPLFHPTKGTLLYLSDESGYYNFYACDDITEGGTTSHPILPMDVDFGGASPGWTLGQMGYSVLEDGRLATAIGRDGKSVLVLLDLEGWDPLSKEDKHKHATTVEFDEDDGLPMQFGSVQGGTNGDLYFMGGDPSTPTSVYRWNMNTKGASSSTSSAILKSSSNIQFDKSFISVPRRIEFPTTLGTAFGYYYPPKNGDFECTTEQAPPLLVKAHGGPTAATGTSFNAGIQYWTSRGFAVLDVDYGGSTGYGRDYRRRLRKSWGIVDIDDVCNGAQYLVEKGLADGEKLCIDGGSAGGYTTLGALAFRDVFKAGCSLYGVADLTLLAKDTHKFESRYLDGLVGVYPEEKEIYKERSPIESVDTLNCPILLLQGDEDKIVPPNQAEKMHEALLSKGIPVCLKIYKGEQHGFRKSENIEDALDSELSFYGRVFGIDIPGAIDISIDNM